MQDPKSTTPEIKSTDADNKTPAKSAAPDGNKTTPAGPSESKPDVKQT